MKTLIKTVVSSLALSTLLVTASLAAEPKKESKVEAIDVETGLKIAPGVDKVKQHCTVCHSAKFILLQRGDESTWKEMITWMQKTQGLWDLGEDEKTILTYLSTNYAPDNKVDRRKNIPASLLPPTH